MEDIYYIEDDPDIANMVKEYLEQKNFRVKIWGTFAEAKCALKKHVPALILLDWNMPDGRGEILPWEPPVQAGRPGGRHVSVFAQKLERTSGNFSHGPGGFPGYCFRFSERGRRLCGKAL